MKLLRVVFVLALVACGGGDGGPTDPNANGFDSFRATIDGQPWNAEYAPVGADAAAGLYVITGMRVTGSNNYTIALTIHNVTGTGTYPLGMNTMMFGGWAIMSQPPSSGWQTPLNGASGQVDITSLSATQIAGTFSFNVEAQSGSAGTHTVTAGSFDVLLSGTAPGVALPNQGSSMTASLGTDSFVGSTLSAVLTAGGSPTLTLVANSQMTATTARTLSISLADMTGAGTYPLSNMIPFRSIGVGGQPGNQSAVWTSSAAGGSGSVTIASVTAQRIVGSFAATVIGAGGGVTGPMTISGQFTLGRP